MISDRIKQLRETAGYSQAQLAKKPDVTRSSVNAWDMWAVRVQIIGLPALLLFGTRFFFI